MLNDIGHEHTPAKAGDKTFAVYGRGPDKARGRGPFAFWGWRLDNRLDMEQKNLLLAKGHAPIELLPRMANRHGLIAGATGTGKTVSMRVLAEQFSDIGVPVFLADVKGDLSGLGRAGGDDPRIQARVAKLELSDYQPAGCPVVFWDVFGERGHPVRATVSEMGPLLLSRLLSLNETQSGVLTLVFKVADDQGWLLLDLKDLRALLEHVGANAQQLRLRYGNVSSASIGAIQRGLLKLESQGGDRFFGEPALDLDDLLQTEDGKGVLNVLVADRLIQAPTLYTTFLLWLLAELFERLPEVGDPDKPRLVFCFDEAHLLFEDAPKELRDRIEQVVRLIRSKGVGVYFVTQSPLDLPADVLGQLGNRVQHALRAFTPKDQKMIRAVGETFRANPGVDVQSALTELAVGEALVSVLDERGVPTPVERAFIIPPRSSLAPLSEAERTEIVRRSSLQGTYEKSVDRPSAYEALTARAAQMAEEASTTERQRDDARGAGGDVSAADVSAADVSAADVAAVIDAFTKSAARAVGSQLGRQIVRGVLGSLLGRRR